MRLKAANLKLAQRPTLNPNLPATQITHKVVQVVIHRHQDHHSL